MPKERSVVRVTVGTGEVVRFPSVTAAQKASGISPISLSLLTNRPLKGYRFFYAEDWKDGE